jgi:hypothetical protein
MELEKTSRDSVFWDSSLFNFHSSMTSRREIIIYNLSIFNLSSIGVILGAIHVVPLVC